MKSIPFIPENFQLIIDDLAQENVCVFPSETSYGISASPFSSKAIEKIQNIKGRPAEKPFLLLVADLEMAMKYGVFSSEMKEFAITRWSSNIPTTLLVPKTEILRDYFPHMSHVGLRVPADAQLRQFLYQWNAPLISTSANKSGENPIFTEQEIFHTFSSSQITLYSRGDLPLKPSSEIWKQENTKLIRVR